MKNSQLVIGFLCLLPLSLFSQAETFHDSFKGSYDFPFVEGYTVHVDLNETLNEVIKERNDGVIEIRYTYNSAGRWTYTNATTGDVRHGPDHGNYIGKILIYPDGSFSDTYHRVYHYVNDPVFGGYHVVVDLGVVFIPPNTFVLVFQNVRVVWDK